MKHETKVKVKQSMDFIYESCRCDSSGIVRAPADRVQKYSWYIGWLEGNLLEFMTDDQAELFMSRIKVERDQHAADEAVFHDDEDGSFY